MNVYLVYISYELWWQGCLRGINARPGEDMRRGDRERERSGTHRVCSWRISLWLGLGGEAELPLCRCLCVVAGLDWHGHSVELSL